MSGFSNFTKRVQGLPPTVPFVGPETLERQRGDPFLARIGANESGFGPAPSVIELMREQAHGLWMYADPEHFDLRNNLASNLGINADQIVLADGIDGLLGLTVRMVTEPQTPIVTSLGAYPTFNYHVAGFGGRLVTVPYENDREDLSGLLERVKVENAPLVYFANPDNPMGSWWNADEIVKFAQALPATTLLVLDEAYSETAPADAIPTIEALIDMPNLVRMRTFSKAYGLAGARVGYAFGTKETIRTYDRVRNHFGMNRLALQAANAALVDQNWLQSVVGEVDRSRRRLSLIARANDLTPLPSATNFVTMDCHRDGDFSRSLLTELGKLGVFVRMPGVAPLDRCIRVSTGPSADMDVFEEMLPLALAALK